MPPCLVATEACGGAHFRARELSKLGHDIRPIPPAWVKPFVKRQKNDAADAKAICEAAQKPNMRFVPVKSEQTQGQAASSGSESYSSGSERRLSTRSADTSPSTAGSCHRVRRMPAAWLPLSRTRTQDSLRVLAGTLSHLDGQIEALDAEIGRRARASAIARRLMTIPGIGPLIATAIATLAPPPDMFRKGRGFAACLGKVPVS